MNQRAMIAAAAASLISSALFSGAVLAQAAPQPSKDKCFGIAKAGQNDCANLSGTHSCAGQAKAELGADEWKYVAKGTCKDMKGVTEAEAKAKLPKKG